MEDIKKRFEELYNRSYNRSYTVFTDFLNMDEQSTLVQMNLPCKACGGFEQAQRVVAGFGEDVEEKDFPIVCVCVCPVMQKFADELTHRDFLGALMNLGIKREMLGDIIVEGNTGYVFCLEQISEYIADNLNRVRHTSVRCEILAQAPDCVSKPPQPLEVFVPSCRADAVISAVYKLSRNEASRLFTSKKIYINSVLCENTSYTLKENDIVSVRGFGKFVFSSIVRKTKKDRLVAAVGKY